MTKMAATPIYGKKHSKIFFSRTGCYIPSFVEIGQPVLEKKIFECFLPYMGVAEKKIFEKCVWTTDWPRSRDDLDLH